MKKVILLQDKSFILEGLMVKFTHTFLRKIQNHNLESPMLVYERVQYSYKDLLKCVNEKIAMLDSIPSGSCIGIVGDYDLDSIAFMLANLEKGNIIAPFIDDNELESKAREGQVDFIYTQGKLENIFISKDKHKIIKILQKSHSNGLILFSSGSTGKPKAIVHNLDNILNEYLSKKPKKINILLFLMFDHIGGLNTLFTTLSYNACGVAIKNRKDINALAQNLQDYKIFMLPASPSLLNLMLLSGVKQKFDLSSLKLITYGTEQMPNTLLQKLKSEFPNVRFHQTFGTSEVGITQTATQDNAIKLENIDYKIINNELYLKSKTQTLGYINADNSVFDNEGYFATGDLVESLNINGEEYIRILGRSKEIINVGGEKVLPQEVENVILEIPFIKDCLVYGEKNAITGQSVSVQVVLEKLNLRAIFGTDSPTNIAVKKELRKFLKNKLAPFKIPSKLEIIENLNFSERFKKVRKKS